MKRRPMMGSYITARPVRGECGLCGRRRLSRSEYAWRRANNLPVWRCQHRRTTNVAKRELVRTLVLLAALAMVCAGAAVLQWSSHG